MPWAHGRRLALVDAHSRACRGTRIAAHREVALTVSRRHVRLALAFGLLLGLFVESAGISTRVFTKAPSQTPQESATDPLGRSTPRGTVTGFVMAMDRADSSSAERFLQITSRTASTSRDVARALSELMDRHFNQPLSTISDDPLGDVNDGLALDRERVGPLTVGDRPVDIVLVRVTDSTGKAIWLISSESLALVPDLRRAMGEAWAQRAMPSPLVNQSVLGLSIAQWIVWVGSIVIPLLLFRLVFQLLALLARLTLKDPAQHWEIHRWHSGLRWPLAILLALATHGALLPLIGFSLRFRLVYGRIVLTLAIIAAAWLLRRLATLLFTRARGLMHGREHAGTRSLTLLAERVLKVVIVVLAMVSILAVVGVDTRTALTGLGIGGVAVALGAQKTVENLLGGVFLLSDRALAVGDFCAISGRQGIVEDITLRSVRLRTLEQTLLSIPAGNLSQAGIENFTTRGKILIQATLRLRYDSTVDQLRSILDRTRALLAAQTKLEPETMRIRLVNFGVHAVEIELYAFVLTADFAEFLAVREDLLLQIAGIVEGSGSGFAAPTVVS